MNKLEFLLELGKALEGLPCEDVEERLSFYGEMIDDKIEEGVSEEDAVAEIGSAEKIAENIISDYPLSKLVKRKVKSQRKLGAWEIVLLAIGSPIWVSLAIAALAVILSLCAVMWSLVAVVWSVFASFAACVIGGITGGTILIACGNLLSGLLLVGAGLACGGLAIFSFFGCIATTKGMAYLTKRIFLVIKKMFIKKGDSK